MPCAKFAWISKFKSKQIRSSQIQFKCRSSEAPNKFKNIFKSYTIYTLAELSFLFSYETNILNEAPHHDLSDCKKDLKAVIYSQKNNDEIYLKNFCKYLNIDFDEIDMKKEFN